MKCFLVDYENVNSAGLVGINKIDKDDLVMIFYSDNANTVTFATMDLIRKSPADIRRYKLKQTSANAADFQICTYLGYLMGMSDATDIFIISRDKGYMSSLEFCRSCLSSTCKNVDIFPNIVDACNSIASHSSIGVTYQSPAQPNDEMKNVSVPEPKVENKPDQQQNVTSIKHFEVTNTVENDSEKPVELNIKTDDLTEKLTPKKAQPEPVQKKENAEKKQPAKASSETVLNRVTVLVSDADGNKQDSAKYGQICKIITDSIANSTDKHDFYLKMVKQYGQKVGVFYYNAIKKEYTNLKLSV
ncbi:MAG: PIN domain-containing protein [Ruminococcus sp.]|nr:PIN domain-containing protein [Ruminococcus sp.]